jgi:anti-anti-sigma factor
MAFNASVSSREGTSTIVMEGDLDASNAEVFQHNIDLAAEHNPQRLILDMTKLHYISSAGLRQLVYARQRLSDDLRVVLVRANERVTETIRLVGFEHSVTFADSTPD